MSAGGFGGKRVSSVMIPILDEPKRSPDSTVTEKTSVNQVMIFIYALGMLSLLVYYFFKYKYILKLFCIILYSIHCY